MFHDDTPFNFIKKYFMFQCKNIRKRKYMYKKLIYTLACSFTLMSLTTHAGDYRKINQNNRSKESSGVLDCIIDAWRGVLDGVSSTIESALGSAEKAFTPLAEKPATNSYGRTPVNTVGYQRPEVISEEYLQPQTQPRVPQLFTASSSSNKLGVGHVHDLAALDKDELKRVVDAVKADSRYWPANGNALFERVSVANVSLYNVGPDTPPRTRAATVALYLPDTDTFWELNVTLLRTSVGIVGRKIPGARPSWSNTDNNIAIEAVLANADVRRALKRRGITDDQIDNGQVQFYTLNDGRINDNGNPEVKRGMPDLDPANGPRPRSMWGYFYLLPSVPTDTTRLGNLFVFPIPGVFAWLDLNKQGNPEDKVLLVHDTGVLTPMPSKDELAEFMTTPNPYFKRETDNLKPIKQEMPKGVSWELKDGWLTWDRWRMFVTIDPVTGPRLHYIQIDKRADRSVGSPDWYNLIDQLNVQEAITAYSGAEYGKVNQNYFDFYEYNYARFGSPLKPKIDGVTYEALYDANFVDETGAPLTIKNGISISEEPMNTSAMRHYDWNTAEVQGAAGKMLKVSFATTVGNYDYVVNFGFDNNGQIHLLANASGMDEMSAGATPDRFSRMLHPNIKSAFHRHVFSFNIVFALGGRGNRFYKKEKVKVPSIYGNTWEMKKTQLSTPQDCLEHLEPKISRHWEVCDHHGDKLIDLPMSVSIEMGHSTESGNEDWTRIAQKTKEFFKYPVIATKYRPDANSYAGKYPVEKAVADGIDINGVDGANFDMQKLSLWLNPGFDHEPTIENFPVLPQETFEIHIKPENMFRQTPSLGERPN